MNNAAQELYEQGLHFYYDGYIDETDPRAFDRFLKAANMGHVSAMFRVSWCYRYGWGVEQDCVKAEYWRRLSTELTGDI